MTEVIQFPSPSSEVEIFRTEEGERGREEEEAVEEIERKQMERDGDQLSILTLLVTAFRRSMVGCSVTVSSGSNKDLCNMEIGVPTNVRHVNHVTFDRYNGFLGLPVEFELEVPRRAPSASATVFGVSTESMQLSYDSRGNSVPTILLMMQRHLYAQGGLEAEGIFRITAGNSQEEFVREQLNKGVIPEGIDVHCLAGLIKAWFRELPTGVLDSLSSEQVMQSQTEEECAQLARQLPSIEAALLDWAINLMADVVQLEHMNKMNAHNIAMVFAPNMTQMSDPLTALMYAVQVINFLKNLIMRMLKEREDCVVASSSSHLKPADDNGDLSSSQPAFQDVNDESSEENGDDNFYVAEEPPLESSHESDKFYAAEEPPLGSQHKNDKSCAAEGPPVESPNDKFYAAEEPPLESPQENDKFCAAEEPSREATRDESSTSSGTQGFLTSIENIPGKSWSLIRNCPCKVISQVNILEKSFTRKRAGFRTKTCKIRISQTNNFIIKRGSKKSSEQTTHSAPAHLEKVKSTGMRGRINPTTEMLESWR